MMVRLAVFDIAGTTVEDPDGVGGCLKAALAAAGIDRETEAVNAVMGIPKPLAIAKLIGEDADAARVVAIHTDFRARMMEYYRTNPSVRPVQGAEAVFHELRGRGLKVALDTGFDRPIVDVLLSRLAWGAELIDATATSDEVANGRPHADLINRLMALTGVDDPAAVAKIGDTPSDLLEGTAANCGLVIGVTSGTHRREQLEPFPHTHLVDSVRDVPACLT